MWFQYFVNFRQLNDHLFEKELFILFAASAFRKLSSIYVFSYFPFGFEGRIWDLIVSVPDHCLSFYFMHNKELESVDTAKYLGVNISRVLSWNTHINNITASANRTLGFVKRNVQTKIKISELSCPPSG